MIKIVLLKELLNFVRDQIADNIDKGRLGVSGVAATESQTGLQNADASTLLDLSSVTKSDKSFKINYTLPSTGGSTTTYREFEIQYTGGSINVDRSIFTGISFTSGGNEDINISKTYFVRQ